MLWSFTLSKALDAQLRRARSRSISIIVLLYEKVASQGCSQRGLQNYVVR